MSSGVLVLSSIGKRLAGHFSSKTFIMVSCAVLCAWSFSAISSSGTSSPSSSCAALYSVSRNSSSQTTLTTIFGSPKCPKNAVASSAVHGYLSRTNSELLVLSAYCFSAEKNSLGLSLSTVLFSLVFAHSRTLSVVSGGPTPYAEANISACLGVTSVDSPWMMANCGMVACSIIRSSFCVVGVSVTSIRSSLPSLLKYVAICSRRSARSSKVAPAFVRSESEIFFRCFSLHSFAAPLLPAT
mmetsp:Transcript_100412/g.284478  ORF Transcript_100412/g.284478 Transcript_100412/m.284478 type:complete len:241 (-) Transcript_100412:2487-3209(-)